MTFEESGECPGPLLFSAFHSYWLTLMQRTMTKYLNYLKTIYSMCLGELGSHSLLTQRQSAVLKDSSRLLGTCFCDNPERKHVPCYFIVVWGPSLIHGA